jgi:hypothetical protein
MTSDVLDRVACREPLATNGKSGSGLEWGRLKDGSVVVSKHSDIDQSGDEGSGSGMILAWIK